MIAAWPCPGPHGQSAEYAFTFDRGRSRRLLIVPALFDEANRTRRFVVEAMRLLDEAGVDTVLPDLPGCNESLQSFREQTLDGWRAAMTAALDHFGCTEVLAIRGGALVAPHGAAGWQLEPPSGRSQLRQLLRARTIAAREEGRNETVDGLLEEGRRSGLELAGYSCSAALLGGLEAAKAGPALTWIHQNELGGGALWLRAEPGQDNDQSATLAAIVAGAARA